jgi:Fur family ferric uptake transcriptional regulator
MEKQIESRLTNRKIKPTAMRLLVLDYLVKQPSAVSLTDIENAFEKSDRVTLYRTLKTFEDSALIHSINDGSGATKYALCQEGCECSYPNDIHLHFYCEKCQRTFCLPKVKMPALLVPDNFNLNHVSLVGRGTCDLCAP